MLYVKCTLLVQLRRKVVKSRALQYHLADVKDRANAVSVDCAVLLDIVENFIEVFVDVLLENTGEERHFIAQAVQELFQGFL